VRTLLFLTVLASSSVVDADPFAEIVGGIALPQSNSNWTNTVDASPKLGVRAGAMSDRGDLGGMLALDWTPESLNSSGGSFGIGSTSASLHRFRLIASGVFRHRIAPKVTISARAGAGIDVARGSYEVTVLGSTSSHSNVDVGYAFELGAGVWFDVSSVQLGVELAVPIGHHDSAASQQGDIAFQYTDVDIDLLVGVRF
jgi:hypothetical protein